MDISANTISDAGVPTPEHQQRLYMSPTPADRKTPGGSRQSAQHPTTPTRLNQHSATNGSPLQSFQNDQAPERAILAQTQRAGCQQLFSEYVQRLNNTRIKAGQPQLTVVEAWPAFNKWMANMAPQQQQRMALLMHGSPQFNTQSNTTMSQNLNRIDGQSALQSPFTSTASPFGQQPIQSASTQSPLSNRVDRSGLSQQAHLQQQYQQSPQRMIQNNLQSPAMPSHTFNSLYTSTAGDSTNPVMMPPSNAFQTQAAPQEVNTGADETDLAAQLSAHLDSRHPYPYPENSQGAQAQFGANLLGEIPGWASPTPNPEPGLGESYKQADFDGSMLQTLGDSFLLNGFSAAANDLDALPSDLQDIEASANSWPQPQGADRLAQQMPQRSGLDPTLLLSSAAQDPNSTPDPTNGQPSSHQRQPSEAQSNASTRPTQPRERAPSHPPTSRKHPASSRSTPAAPALPAFPACLHCHAQWWNDTCDAGSPCRNCAGAGTACERPQCHLPAGTCSGATCSRVHEGDLRFGVVVPRPKTLRRVGRRSERQMSPVEMGVM